MEVANDIDIGSRLKRSRRRIGLAPGSVCVFHGKPVRFDGWFNRVVHTLHRQNELLEGSGTEGQVSSCIEACLERDED